MAISARRILIFFIVAVLPIIRLILANYLGSAELISSHRQRVADVDPHSDDNDEKPPDFGQVKTKFPQELHHVFNLYNSYLSR